MLHHAEQSHVSSTVFAGQRQCSLQYSRALLAENLQGGYCETREDCGGGYARGGLGLDASQAPAPGRERVREREGQPSNPEPWRKKERTEKCATVWRKSRELS